MISSLYFATGSFLADDLGIKTLPTHALEGLGSRASELKFVLFGFYGCLSFYHILKPNIFLNCLFSIIILLKY